MVTEYLIMYEIVNYEFLVSNLGIGKISVPIIRLKNKTSHLAHPFTILFQAEQIQVFSWDASFNFHHTLVITFHDSLRSYVKTLLLRSNSKYCKCHFFLMNVLKKGILDVLMIACLYKKIETWFFSYVFIS
jgi:hypothetical protein